MPAKELHNSTNLNIRISPTVKDLLEIRAARLGISASEYVRLLIMEDARHLLDEQYAQADKPDNSAAARPL